MNKYIIFQLLLSCLLGISPQYSYCQDIDECDESLEEDLKVVVDSIYEFGFSTSNSLRGNIPVKLEFQFNEADKLTSIKHPLGSSISFEYDSIRYNDSLALINLSNLWLYNNSLSDLPSELGNISSWDEVGLIESGCIDILAGDYDYDATVDYTDIVDAFFSIKVGKEDYEELEELMGLKEKNKRLHILNIALVLVVLIGAIATHFLRKTIKKLKKQNEFIKKQIQDYTHTHQNSLQLISSHLGFLSRGKYRQNRSVANDINKVDGMIRNAGEVYELLYKRQELTMNIGKFVRKILDNRFEQFKIRNLDVSQHLNIDEIDVPRNIAQYIGMIINEAVRNSCKYAFDGIESPQIAIDYKVMDNFHHVGISDNGNGYDISQLNLGKTDGISLMKEFCDDLQSELIIDTENGTHYSFKFNPLKLKRI